MTLYLIGGASRAGKTALAGLLLRRRHVPFLSIDLLKMALHDAQPSAFPGPDQPPGELVSALRPVLHGLGNHALGQGLPYCLEGDLLTPADAVHLAELHPGVVRACFLGYPTIAVSEKARHLQRFRGFPNDWVNRDLDPAGRLAHAESGARRSRDLERECRAAAVPFVDTGTGFTAGLRRAYRLLIR